MILHNPFESFSGQHKESSTHRLRIAAERHPTAQPRSWNHVLKAVFDLYILLLRLFIYLMYVSVCACVHTYTHATVPTRRSKDNLCE